jgi:hypothetical protein
MFMLRLQPRDSPVRHYRSSRPQPAAISAACPRVLGPDCRQRRKLCLSGAIMTRLEATRIGRRMKIYALKRCNGSIYRALAPTRHPRQRILGRSPKRRAISRQQRARKARNQNVGISIIDERHGRQLHNVER